MGKERDRRERAAAAAAEFIEEARERAEEALERAEEAYEHAHDVVEDGIGDAQRFIRRQWRKNPVGVAATALGIGIVIGVLIGGSRR